jgi:signal transduction histidine kinase
VQEALATGACRPFEKEYVRKDGTLLPALVGLVLLQREPLRLMGFVLDRSDQRRLEREREEADAHARAVVQVNRHMDEFFATAAHDIRSPVMALCSNLQVTQRRVARLRSGTMQSGIEYGEERMSDMQARFAAADQSLAAANLSAERLTRAVTLLFDVAQARAGKLTLRLAPCDLAQVVRDQVEEARATALGRDIRVEVLEDAPVCVQADADRLSQVLGNYLSNALKYSDRAKPVVVRLEVTAPLAVVSVQDEGPGLPWGEQSRVWEMFHQAPGVTLRSSATGSLGLGLHICKRIVELHGGRVGVESVEGEGSIFWFSLKLADLTA